MKHLLRSVRRDNPSTLFSWVGSALIAALLAGARPVGAQMPEESTQPIAALSRLSATPTNKRSLPWF